MAEPGTVRVGLHLTHQRRPEQDPVTTLDEQLGLVRLARDEGLDSVFAGQHHLAESFAHIQPLPWLARLAAEAGEMTVGTGCHLLAVHNPVDTAEAYASLDVVCRGRSVLAVGLGYREEEYAAFGVPAREKVRRFTENLAIVDALWRGESVTRDLPWTRLDGARLVQRPVARPRPPIWITANADNAVRRAARLADAWMINPHATAATVRRQLELFDAERAEHGLGPAGARPLMREVFCADTREQALERARPYLESKYAVYADWGQDRVMPDRESFRMGFEELADDRFVIGTPDDCTAALSGWLDLGIDHFVLRTDWPGTPVEHARRSVELLAREVAPALRSSVPQSV
ncbi:LLM class flavin-dependent oxidoreductase [Actinomycetospora sp. TBRC 11914]|uniref:LLM class flavin-dependent oxidoreductase n=1 Tax=Actinomycetospora sp. TBRC 11914 TaxID=2729387 RepID=UPI00145F64C6|nr:LLM class flavin-dependent oxidoreductase [Actinomycetospora sp. TBRC 11914]NMO92950.1 LLM class flavin-dependent oxidoreductase [Actinomycetospora sp. TBRC 11914]